MAETEVESILREIRERVVAQERASRGVAASAVAFGAASVGNGDAGAGQQIAATSHTISQENLALINSYLTTTARAWDRLPPVVSNRSGLAARLELWLKRHLKRATRWYAWEQVNFNAAVHHALRDMLPVLAAYEQELGRLRASIDAEVAARQTEREQYQTSQRELTARIEGELVALRRGIELQRQAMDAQAAQTQALRSLVDVRIAELVRELRERDERLQDEQRVSFKQLALQTGEAAVLEDRARRKTEVLLEELRRRVEELEK